MIEYAPPATQAPVRMAGGQTTPGRHTTTQEQRQAAIDFALSEMATAKTKELRIKVEWSRGEPTILEVIADVEHLGDKPIHVMRKVTEFTAAGVEIRSTAQDRADTLVGEVADLIERDML